MGIVLIPILLGNLKTNTMWYNKYSPLSLDELSLSSNYKEIFSNWIDKSYIPHVIFAGPQGSGKTSLARILIDSIPSVSLKLNASSKDRGVDTIKGKVADFASSYSGKKWNIVLLDEGEGLTPDAMDALKGVYDAFEKTTRFIITTNNIHKIIKPLQSRSQIFHFEQFPKRKLLGLCETILTKENVEYDRETVKQIVDLTYPDFRSTINLLEYSSYSGKLILKDYDEFTNSYNVICDCIAAGDLETIFSIGEKIIDFEYFYRQFIQDNINNHEIVLTVSDWYDKHSRGIDKLIPFMGVCIELMGMRGVKPKFK